MDERLNAYLDGELPLDDLTSEERRQAAAFEAAVDRIRSDLDAAAPADLESPVMSRIAQLGLEPLPSGRASVLGRGLAWLLTPRPLELRWRPIYGLAAAAVALVLVVDAPWLRGPAPGAPGGTDAAAVRDAAASQAAGQVYIQFRLDAGAANEVTLAGSFTGWRPIHPLQQAADGVWTVLLAIPPGVHDYAFVIDGERWVADPYAPQVDDGFGGVNSRLTLLSPAEL